MVGADVLHAVVRVAPPAIVVDVEDDDFDELPHAADAIIIVTSIGRASRRFMGFLL